MKNSCLALGLLLAPLSWPWAPYGPGPRSVGAEVAVAELKIRRQGPKLNIRVTARNPAGKWRGPVSLRLMARVWNGGPWVTLRTWPQEHALGPGQKLCRDYFDENSLILSCLALAPRLHLKARVQAPGLYGEAEKIVQRR